MLQDAFVLHLKFLYAVMEILFSYELQSSCKVYFYYFYGNFCTPAVQLSFLLFLNESITYQKENKVHQPLTCSTCGKLLYISCVLECSPFSWSTYYFRNDHMRLICYKPILISLFLCYVATTLSEIFSQTVISSIMLQPHPYSI